MTEKASIIMVIQSMLATTSLWLFFYLELYNHEEEIDIKESIIVMIPLFVSIIMSIIKIIVTMG